MNIEDILNTPFTFTKRKNFYPCDTRPLWKSCLIILILGISGRKHAASLKKIHVANWVVKDKSHEESYVSWGGKDNLKRPDIRLDPAIDRVINLLVSNKMLSKSDGRITLTETGVLLYKQLESEDIFLHEKKSLKKVSRYLSEAAVKRLFEGV